jgi:dihydrofolate reductase
MARVLVDISMSLDGFVAGPNPSLEHPLGLGGEQLHEWAFRVASWRRQHGLEGGETGPDDDLVAASLRGQGAVVMGRRMFSGGSGPWEDDPNADGWWGDDPPFHVRVFVLTHHTRATLEKQGGTSFTFVTDGIESAIEQARAAAGDRDVLLAGGADAVQQGLNAGLVDELMLHVSPVLLGDGVRLLDNLAPGTEVELTGAVASPAVAHLSYRTT